MASHGSANVREHIPHGKQTSRTNTIVDALKRRAQAALNDKAIDAQSRAIIRYALETNDPWLARLVRHAETGEDVIQNIQTRETSKDDDEHNTVEALAELICMAGEESTAALFVLMGTLVNCTDAKALANTAKHLAFTRCGELNCYGIVDAQIAVFERELLRQ